MIRRSTAIATLAILLSLFAHFVGLSVSMRIQPAQSTGDTATDVVTLDNRFEDIADPQMEPVQPELSETPEPQPETAPEPEPEPAEAPTSEALVASSNPQETFAPDTGSAQSETAGPAAPTQSGVPDPETVDPIASGAGTAPTVAEAVPVEGNALAEVPELAAQADTAEASDAPADEPPEPDIAVEPQAVEVQELAALPEPLTPVAPVAPAPIPEAVPVVPLDRTTVDPVVTSPDIPKAEIKLDEVAPPDVALVSSLRPRLPTRRPPETTSRNRNASAGSSGLRDAPTNVIESPLEAYRRNRTDLIGRSGGQRSGGSGFEGGRGPGNSDVTNYVGRVLVHLNRVPPIRVPGRGYARVLFMINPDGSLGSVDVVDIRGSSDIEAAAKQQIRNAVPFPPPPNGVRRRLSFVYRNF